jgi:AraC-like DNA-binding protein
MKRKQSVSKLSALPIIMTNIIIDREHIGSKRIDTDEFYPLVEKTVWADFSRKTTQELYREEKHLHHFHQLDVILDGEYKLILDGGKTEIGHAGDAWIIPPLTWHGIECSKPYYFCSFKFHMTPRFWTLFGNQFHRLQVSEEARQYISLCNSKWDKQNIWANEQISAMLSLCLVEFLEQNSQMPAQEGSLGEFRQALWPLLQEFLKDPSVHWTVARMASEMGLSVSYFTHCFYDVIGQSPRRYILESTMRAAAGHLLDGKNISIKQIAKRAGYANVHSFSRAFALVFKIGPAGYRKQAG